MKTLRFSLPQEQPGKDGVVPLVCWKQEELLEIAEAGEEARYAFSTETIMLMAGGWQSWSPGWELAPGEKLPGRVWLIPLLRKLSAAPWECKRNGSSPAKKYRRQSRRDNAEGSFIMYLRAGPWYLVIAAAQEKAGMPPLPPAPVCFSVSPDRWLIRAGVFVPEKTERFNDKPVAELRIFLVKGFFDLKDQLKKIYPQDRFSSLQFLGTGEIGKDFRPGGYASWYNHYTKIDESIILSDLEGLQKTDNLIALKYIKNRQPAIFQIDDGWERAVGDWEIDGEKFPRGLKCLAEKIENAGLIPGLWLAPFLITRRARIFTEKPGWLLTTGSRPVEAGWNPHWDGPFYCLDLSKEEVLEYLRSLINQVIDEWGFRYIKLDFLYAGMFPGDNAGKFAGGCDPALNYERAVSILTERSCNAAGLPLAYLGCGLPLGSSYRHFPLARIGTDTKEAWDWPLAKFIRHEGRPSALLSLRDTIGRSFMHGAVYINDPDVIFLRSANCKLTETEKECIALVNFLFAGQVLCSDDFFALTKTDLAFTRRIKELYEKLEGEEYGPVNLGKDRFLLESRSGKISGLINLNDKPFLLNAASFSGGTWLVDHRVNADRFCFAPRSISIYKY